MKYSKFGEAYTNTQELAELLYQNPDVDLGLFRVEDCLQFNRARQECWAEFSNLVPYIANTADSLEEFDQTNQSQWWMPQEYQDLDIARWVLEQCKTDAELQRCGEELILFQERNLFPLLNFLKYLVDKMREERVVWGVGRGSSVASFVLYLIGVHRINSLYYDLDPREFLK